MNMRHLHKQYDELRYRKNIPPHEVLNVALIDKKGVSNHLRVTNKFRSSHNLYNNSVNNH